MKVVLLKDVPALGKKDTAVEVAEGYARNYLIPRGLALAASSAQLKRIEDLRDAERRREAKEEAKAREDARKLKAQGITMRAKAGEGGKLYGSITAKDVAESIRGITGLEVDRRKVELRDPIKELGEHYVTVRLYPGVSADVMITIVPE